jgi:class 3 adenylate cyclase
MGEKNILRFPTERRIRTAAREHAERVATRGQAVPADQPQAAQAEGEPFALLSLEIRRLPRTDSRIGGDIAGRILNRCVLSSLEVLSKERIPVDLAGTVLRPMLEAPFQGEDGVVRAARAAAAVRDAVRKVQREVELEFHVFGAICTGTVSALEGGVKLTSGSPEQLAARLREHAAPGQVLLSEDALALCEREIAVTRPAVQVTIPGSEPVASYPLTDPHG